MDADSKRFLSTLRSRSEILMGFEEIDGEDDFQEEFACPFCAESYDIIGLCCHIDDEHTLESKNAVCPVCSLKVGVDIVAHITLHHGSLFKISFFFLHFLYFLVLTNGITLLLLKFLNELYLQRKRKSRKSGTNSTLSFLRKELREGDLQRLLGFTSRNGSVASSVTPDPLLSSFISPTRSHLSPAIRQTRKVSEEKQMERKRQVCISPVSSKDREERRQKSEFVQRLLSSAIFDEV
ncbi:Protein DEHYDRATION-INDUCED 19 [Cardamine amara subsp. amara]|uniref:Protein DEHYDRATION-INDUCED 19 n=1 Tax=Cardamine amara subsp. amara TaxID=228776 RepID=A0ABD0Z043_CARAN